MIIELKGRIGADGKITLTTPTNLPPGEVDIVITYPDEDEAQDEALWDDQFSATPTTVFNALIEQGLNDLHNGETDDFDPNVEDD